MKPELPADMDTLDPVRGRKGKRGVMGPFFTRRQCLLPTWRAWVLLLLLVIAGTTLFVRGLYPFLAVNQPLRGGVLVVEGWTSDYTVQAAAEEFQTGHYEKIYVVGGPIDRGAALKEYDNFAQLGAATLIALGMAPEKVQAVPSPSVPQDRTYTEGRALHKWWEVHGGAPTQLHLFSEGAHARRSRLMFEMALEKKVRVGITSVPPRTYDSNRWWVSSAGFRTVISEFIAYSYARIFFRP
jgi:hypothetical protein